MHAPTWTPARPYGSWNTSAGLAEARERLDRAAAALGALAGRREELRLREDALLASVGRAKGRLALRPGVEDLLRRLQARAHERSVGAYERLLTGIVADVLPGDRRIHLDLGTERGLPSLDIEVGNGPHREGIMDGSGGSLTNVVSAGLRFAALVRSGRRRFIAMDEPDCWLAPDRVPDFCGVLTTISREVGVQTLIVSHHDPAFFGRDAFVLRLEAAEGRLRVLPEAGPAPAERVSWRPDEPGLRSLRLIDFMGHEDTAIPLAPGVTVVAGPNNLGKSALLSALRALAYGGATDAAIRHGAQRARVEVEIEGGRRIVWERRRRGTGKVVWRRLGADGTVEMETAAAREVPEWVPAGLGIAPVDGIDIQIGHQKRPIFLLDQPPSQRARILSVGRESGHLAAMLEGYRDLVRRDTDETRRGEAELAALRDRLSGFESLDAASEALRAARSAEASLIPLLAEEAELAASLDRLEKLAAGLEEAEAAGRSLSELPAAPPPLEPETPLSGTIDRLCALEAGARRASVEAAALERLPDAPPAMPADGLPALAGMLAGLERLARDASTRQAEAERTGIELAEAEADLDLLVERAGNVCPLCGQPVGEIAGPGGPTHG